jgi:hypothetical protein
VVGEERGQLVGTDSVEISRDAGVQCAIYIERCRSMCRIPPRLPELMVDRGTVGPVFNLNEQLVQQVDRAFTFSTIPMATTPPQTAARRTLQ